LICTNHVPFLHLKTFSELGIKTHKTFLLLLALQFAVLLVDLCPRQSIGKADDKAAEGNRAALLIVMTPCGCNKRVFKAEENSYPTSMGC